MSPDSTGDSNFAQGHGPWQGLREGRAEPGWEGNGARSCPGREARNRERLKSRQEGKGGIERSRGGKVSCRGTLGQGTGRQRGIPKMEESLSQEPMQMYPQQPVQVRAAAGASQLPWPHAHSPQPHTEISERSPTCHPHTFSHLPVAPEHALSTQRRPSSPSSLMEFGGQDPRRWSVQDSRRETAATFAQGARPNGKWLLPWQAGGLSRTYAPPTSPLPTSYAGSSGGTGQTRRCWPPQPGFSPNPRSRLEP